MGLPVLIIGFSGSGKSASMQKFEPDELSLVNVNGKPLPFRTKFKSTLCSDDYGKIKEFIKTQKNKVIVIDDCQYLLANAFMRRTKETGYQKFTDMARDFWDLVKSIELLPEDVAVYFLGHIDIGEDGRQKFKTVGKLLDEKINVEGMFTVVLKTVVSEGKYYFATQTNGADTCKSPIGLFDSMYISNDLKFVDNALRTYYSFVEGHTCSDCGAVIMPTERFSVDKIIETSAAKFGRKLCISCGKKAAANAVESVSD